MQALERIRHTVSGQGATGMNDLLITYGGIDYLDRTRPLADGLVKPTGISIKFVALPPSELFRRVTRNTEFDAAEMSFSTYANLISRGDDRYIAIPFFPSRHFRHGDVYVHHGSEINQPADLREKTIGIPEYQMTAAVWQRAFLQHDYGVLPKEMHWRTGGLRMPGYRERNPIPDPPGVTIDLIPETKSLEGMLASGELAALVSPVRPPALLDGSNRVRRLFPNYREVEEEYYRRTGFFPIMHLVVIRRDLYLQHRSIAASLLRAFVQAQHIGWAQLRCTEALQVILPWLAAEIEATTELMGRNHWKQGFPENYKTVDALCRYHHEQGLSNRRLVPEELFAEETHEMPLENRQAGFT